MYEVRTTTSRESCIRLPRVPSILPTFSCLISVVPITLILKKWKIKIYLIFLRSSWAMQRLHLKVLNQNRRLDSGEMYRVQSNFEWTKWTFIPNLVVKLIVKVLYEQKSCQIVFVNSLTCPPSSDQVESFKLIQRIQPLDSSQMRISLSPIMRPLQDLPPKFANNSPPDDQANRVDQLRSSEFVWIIRLKQWTGYSDECVEIIISIPIIRIINRSCCWLLGSLSRDKCRERRRFFCRPPLDSLRFRG